MHTMFKGPFPKITLHKFRLKMYTLHIRKAVIFIWVTHTYTHIWCSNKCVLAWGWLKKEAHRCTQYVYNKIDEKETPASSYHKIFNMHIPPTQIKECITHDQRKYTTYQISCNISEVWHNCRISCGAKVKLKEKICPAKCSIENFTYCDYKLLFLICDHVITGTD